jgi:hypothetical protein
MFAAAKSGGVVSSGDPYWADVSLLTNFDNNLSFRDESTNNFAITRTGVVNPSLNTPFTGGVGGSEKFTYNSGSTLTVPNSAAFNLSAVPFTIEMWIYPQSNGGFLVCKDAVSGVSFPQYTVALTASNNIRVELGSAAISGSFQAYITTSAVTLNQWSHIAVSVTSATVYVFIDGVLGATGSRYSGMGSASGVLQIGYQVGLPTSLTFDGFISNIRILKDTALYTANFTPPTAPLTAIANTSLLITGTGQGMFDNATFVDQSPIASTLTATGTPVYSGSSPFGNTYPGSVLFNGASQYLTSSYSTAAFDWWVTDFTIEAWVYPTTFTGWSSSPGFVPMPTLIGNMNVGTVTNYWSFGPTTAGVLSFSYYYGFTTNSAVTSTTALALNQWNHIAMTKTSSGILLFVNGIAQTTTVIVGTPQSSAATPLAIGQYNNTAINGYVSNIRIVKGTAVYTANFTPSTTPLTAITNTSLLVRGDTGAFYDLSNNGNSMTSTGTTAVTTQVKKYGAESASYTATAYQTVADAVNLQLSTGDYTIEAWVYRNAAGVLHSLICKGAAATGWLLQVNSSNQLVFTVTSTAILTSTTTIAATTWTFVTVTRSGTSTRLFVGGNLEATATDSTNFNQTNALLVGSDRSNANGLNGYLDDIRITKGVARYTATFTPRTATFPTGP